MNLEEYSSDDIIFNFGDKGDKFYIILSGSVSVKVPAKRRLFVSKHTVNRLEKFLDDPKAESSSEDELPVRKREGHVTVDVSQVMNALKEQATAERDLTSRTAILSAEEKNLLALFSKKVKEEQKILMNAIKHSDKEKLEIEFDDLNEIGILFTGGAFGELALISDRPRSATIQVRERSSFLVLSKSDFTRILGDIAEKKMTSIIAFLQKVPYFHSRSKSALVRMAYHFQTRTFRKNRWIYKELDPVDGIYLIRDGEVTLTKKRVLNLDSGTGFEPGPSGFLSRGGKRVTETVQVKLVIKGSCEGFGGFEVIQSLSLRTYSCVCSSISCEVLFMPRSAFLSRVPHLDLFRELIVNDHARIMNRFEESSGKQGFVIDKAELGEGKRSAGSTPAPGEARSVTPVLGKEKSFYTAAVCRSQVKKQDSLSQRQKRVERGSPFRQLTKKEILEAVNGRNSIMKRYGSRLNVNSSFSALPNRLKTAASYKVIRK